MKELNSSVETFLSIPIIAHPSSNKDNKKNPFTRILMMHVTIISPKNSAINSIDTTPKQHRYAL
jgi:hypothetical protein